MATRETSLRIGVIGCGVMGDRHVMHANTHTAAEVVGVADVDAEKVKAMADKHKVPKVYASGSELLDDPDIEAVIIALPTCYRTALALKAFAKGKHVLTEKPVAMNAGEVEQMISARGDLVAGCCSSRLMHYDSAKAVRDLIASGALGEIRTVHCRCMMGAPGAPDDPKPEWRLVKSLNGGGILLNWGCYDLNYLMGVTSWQLVPQLVLAQTWAVPDPIKTYISEESDAETHFTSLFRCDGGKVITFERAEYVMAKAEDAWKIVGDRASLHLNMLPGEKKKITMDKPDPKEGLISQTVWEGDEDADLIHCYVVHDFIDAVAENRPCETSLERALIIQKMSDAIYASAQTSKAVTIY